MNGGELFSTLLDHPFSKQMKIWPQLLFYHHPGRLQNRTSRNANNYQFQEFELLPG